MDKYKAQLELKAQELANTKKKGMETEGLVMRLTSQVSRVVSKVEGLGGYQRAYFHW